MATVYKTRECQLKATRAWQARNPDYMEKQKQDLKAKYQSDEEYKATKLGKFKERYHSDPEFKVKQAERHKAWYQKKKSKVGGPENLPAAF